MLVRAAILWSCVALGATGCGDGSDGDDEERKPDTGYGAGQPVPVERACGDLCVRLGDCATALCNEDTRSSRYDGLEPLLVAECESTCSEPVLDSELTEDQWRCLFESSCREVFDYDDCSAEGSYYCR